MTSQNIGLSSWDILCKRIHSDSRKVDKFCDEWFLYSSALPWEGSRVLRDRVDSPYLHEATQLLLLVFLHCVCVCACVRGLLDVPINVDDVRWSKDALISGFYQETSRWRLATHSILNTLSLPFHIQIFCNIRMPVRTLRRVAGEKLTRGRMTLFC
jgi:hypothetical protein